MYIYYFFILLGGISRTTDVFLNIEYNFDESAY